MAGRMLERRDIAAQQQQFPSVELTDPDTGEEVALTAKHDTLSLGHTFSLTKLVFSVLNNVQRIETTLPPSIVHQALVFRLAVRALCLYPTVVESHCPNFCFAMPRPSSIGYLCRRSLQHSALEPDDRVGALGYQNRKQPHVTGRAHYSVACPLLAL